MCRKISGRFYLYDFQAADLCKSGEELLRGIAEQNYERRQMMGAEMFLQQQLERHPWRTHNPEEADLFIVPSLLALGSTGDLCHVKMEELVAALEKEILASPYYQRNEGRDHMLAVMDWRAVKLTFYEAPPIEKWVNLTILTNFTDRAPGVFESFRQTTRNFILAGKTEKSYLSHGELVTPTLEGVRHVTMPHLAPSIVDSCEVVEGRFACNIDTAEADFEAYKTSRDYSMFFIGNGDRHEIPGSRESCVRKYLRKQGKLVRPVVIEQLEDIFSPNILADSGKPLSKKADRPKCKFDSGPDSVTSNCDARGLDAAFTSSLLRKSRFAVHVQGDDASSSRVFEAFATGTPQLFLADRYFHDVAPFRCQVPYGQAVKILDSETFLADPKGIMQAVLDGLMGAGSSQEWEQLWQAQQHAADDLLWHTAESRVGQHILEDAMRALRGIPRV